MNFSHNSGFLSSSSTMTSGASSSGLPTNGNHSLMSPFVMEAKSYTAVASRNQKSLVSSAYNKYLSNSTTRMQQFNQVGDLFLMIASFTVALVIGAWKASTVNAPDGSNLSTEQRFSVFYNYFGLIFIAGATTSILWSCGLERSMEAVAPLIVSIFYFVYYRSVYMSSVVGEEWFNDFYNMMLSSGVWGVACLSSAVLCWPTYDINKITLGMISPNKNMILVLGILGIMVSGGISLKATPPVPYM